VKAECPLNEFCTLGQNLLELILDPKLLPFVLTNCVAFCCYRISLCSQIVLHFVVADLFVLTDCITFCCHVSLQSHIVICAMKHYECDDCVN
jgi:hypothetical protein